MAVEYVNSDDNILPDYDLQLLVQDTRCQVDVAMAQFLQYVVNKTHPIAGILGKKFEGRCENHVCYGGKILPD